MAFPQDIPEWVSGSISGDGSLRKYHRAVELLRKEGKAITEEAVKDLYVKWNGLIIEPKTEEVEEVEDRPRRGRPVK